MLLIRQTVSLYAARPELDEGGIADLLQGEGFSRTEGVFAACIVPSAFGQVLAAKVGFTPSKEFCLQDARSTWVPYLYNLHPIARCSNRGGRLDFQSRTKKRL